jgi:hypothetical protein
MKKVIQFPKEKSKRVCALKKLEAQRLFLSMSLFSLILVAVFANEQMMRTERPVYVVTNMQGPDRLDALNRAIASAQPLNVFRDLEWEHQLAERLGQGSNDRQPASVSQKVTLMDDLKYGPLAGKYRIRSIDSVGTPLVAEIEYVDSNEITDSPIHLTDAEAFLLKYRALMNVEFNQAKLAYQADGQQSWQLIGQDQQLVGRANFKYDTDGHFLGMAIERAE